MDSYEQFRLFRIKHLEMIGTGVPVYNCCCVATSITKEEKMTQETKPVPHVHQDKIIEWAADPSAVWQHSFFKDKWEDIEKGAVPAWNPEINYRRKPRWFDMEQLSIAKGKPPVEFQRDSGEWLEETPNWIESTEYRFKEVSRHAALKAEWEAKGKPTVEYMSKLYGRWVKCNPQWLECDDYRIKPTPHPDADVLRAIADDKSLIAEFACEGLAGEFWVEMTLNDLRLRIKP